MKNIFVKGQARRMSRILANHVNLLILLIIVQAFAACNNDDDNAEAGHELPLQFTTQMDAPQTRATVNNTWEGGEQVQVSIDGLPAQAFTAASNGTLLPALSSNDEIIPFQSGDTYTALLIP